VVEKLVDLLTLVVRVGVLPLYRKMGIDVTPVIRTLKNILNKYKHENVGG